VALTPGSRLGVYDMTAPIGGEAPYTLLMKAPLINVEERIDRLVGRRTRTADPLSVASSRRADAEAWRRAFGGLRGRRGVYRFHSHQEADEWLWRMMARTGRT
jgi:hypothetical protein